MEKLIALINEIQDCTLIIEVHYPELYKELDETPLQNLFSGISTIELEDYLDKIKTNLETYKDTKCHEPNTTI